MDLPKNVLMDQIINLVTILSNKLTGSSVQEIKALNNSITDKVIEAAVFVGLIKEQGTKYYITDIGKKYSQAQDQRLKDEALRELLKNIPIYNLTTEYFHYNKIEKPTKLDVGTYWNDNFNPMVKGMNEDDFTSSIIFYLRYLELASIGKFINAGRGRETRIDINLVELAKYVTSNPTPSELKVQVKNEKKNAQHETSNANQVEEGNSTNLTILKKLNPELIWSDLDSDGARKLIIDKLNVLNNDNIVLLAKVDEYQKLESENAVLNEKVDNLKKDNLFRSSVNSIGGVILGAALTIVEPVYKIVGVLLGSILILVSIFLKEHEKKTAQE